MSVYENINILCNEKKISIRQLEKRVGIGNGIIGKWNSRGSSPRIESLQKVAQFFDVSIDDLLKEKNDAETGAA